MKTINAIKGFNKDMTCTPTSDIKFHYKEGESMRKEILKLAREAIMDVSIHWMCLNITLQIKASTIE